MGSTLLIYLLHYGSFPRSFPIIYFGRLSSYKTLCPTPVTFYPINRVRINNSKKISVDVPFLTTIIRPWTSQISTVSTFYRGRSFFFSLNHHVYDAFYRGRSFILSEPSHIWYWLSSTDSRLKKILSTMTTIVQYWNQRLQWNGTDMATVTTYQDA